MTSAVGLADIDLADIASAAADAEPGDDLTMHLYQHWYAAPSERLDVPDDLPRPLHGALRAANATRATWEAGWNVERCGPRGAVVVRGDGGVRMASRSEYLVLDGDGAVTSDSACTGSPVLIAGRRDRLDPDGGWWRTAGRAWRFTTAHPGMVRMYWNTDPVGAIDVVEQVTALLADDPRPWMLKCAADPEVYRRRDAVVLYLARDVVEARADELAGTAVSLAGVLRTGQVPFTLPVAVGVGAAVDPPGDESFGQHRCARVAEAVRRCDGKLGVLRDAIGSALTDVDVDIDTPHRRRSDGALPWER